MSKTIAWFELPVTDLQRARRFYEAVLQQELRLESFGSETLCVLPYDREGGATGGALVQRDGWQPGMAGATVYLNAGESLEPLLARVEPAGGKVAQPKTELGPGMGSFALIADSEGNRVGLHALK